MRLYINNGNDELRPWYVVAESNNNQGEKIYHIVPMGDCVDSSHIHTIKSSIVNRGFATSEFCITYPYEAEFLDNLKYEDKGDLEEEDDFDFYTM